MEELLVKDREELRAIVAAYYQRSRRESQRFRERFAELAELEEGVTDDSSLLFWDALSGILEDVHVRYLLGEVSEDEWFETVMNVVAEISGGSTPFDSDGDENEERKEKIRAGMRIGIRKLLRTLGVEDMLSREKNIAFINRVVVIANERGVTPVEVFAHEDLYWAMTRAQYSSDEYFQRMEAVLKMYADPEQFLEKLLMPILEQMMASEVLDMEEMTEEEVFEALEEFKEEMKEAFRSNPEVAEAFERMRAVFNEMLNEQMARYFGEDAPDAEQ